MWCFTNKTRTINVNVVGIIALSTKMNCPAYRPGSRTAVCLYVNDLTVGTKVQMPTKHLFENHSLIRMKSYSFFGSEQTARCIVK